MEVESPGGNKDVQNGSKIKCNKCDEPYEWKKLRKVSGREERQAKAVEEKVQDPRGRNQSIRRTRGMGSTTDRRCRRIGEQTTSTRYHELQSE